MAYKTVYTKGIGQLVNIHTVDEDRQTGKVKPLFCFSNNKWHESKLDKFVPNGEIFIHNVPYEYYKNDIVQYEYFNRPNPYKENHIPFQADELELFPLVPVYQFGETPSDLCSKYYYENETILAGPYENGKDLPEFVWDKCKIDIICGRIELDGVVTKLCLEEPIKEQGVSFQQVFPIYTSEDEIENSHKYFYRENDNVIHGPYTNGSNNSEIYLWDKEQVRSILVGNIGDFAFYFNKLPESKIPLGDLTKWIKEKCKQAKMPVPDKYLRLLESIEPYKVENNYKGKIYKKVLQNKVAKIQFDHEILKDIERECQTNSAIRALIEEFVDNNKEEYEKSYKSAIESKYSKMRIQSDELEAKNKLYLEQIAGKETKLININTQLSEKEKEIQKYRAELDEKLILSKINAGLGIKVHLQHFTPENKTDTTVVNYQKLEKIIITEDIVSAWNLAKYLGEHKKLVLHPNPKWLSFDDLYSSGFILLWNSALTKQDLLHILMIQGFNLTLPECWGYPLWNLYNGVSNCIPYSEYIGTWPENLVVILSKVPDANDENYGLPINNYFKDFATYINGKIKFEGNINHYRDAFK